MAKKKAIKKPAKKKRNYAATEGTLINVRAAKKRTTSLDARVDKLEKQMKAVLKEHTWIKG